MRLFILLCFLTVPALALANPIPSVEAIRDNSELFQWIFAFMSFMVLGLTAYFVRLFHEDSKKQWDKLDGHDERLRQEEIETAVLKREHELRMLSCPAVKKPD